MSALEENMLNGHGFITDIFETFPKMKYDSIIPIATKVKFTYMAAVVRWKYDIKMWKITEPKLDYYPPINKNENEDYFFSNDTDDFWTTPLDGINKSVIVWKQKGVAYIFGFVRRGIGKSVKSSYSHSSYFGKGEYDQGYFDAKLYVPLYALKSHIQGVDYFFAPIQSVEVL